MHRTEFLQLNRDSLPQALKRRLKIRTIKFSNDGDEVFASQKDYLQRFFSYLRSSLQTVHFPLINSKHFKTYFKFLRNNPNLKKISTEFTLVNEKSLSSTLKRMKRLNNAYKTTDRSSQTWFRYSQKIPSTEDLRIQFQTHPHVGKVALKRKLPNLRSISYLHIPLYIAEQIDNLVEFYFNHLPLQLKRITLSFEYPRELKAFCLVDSEIFWHTLGKSSSLESIHINLFQRLDSNWDKALKGLTNQLKNWPGIKELTISIGKPILSVQSIKDLCAALTHNKLLKSVILNSIQVVVDTQDFIEMMNQLLSLPKLETLAFKDVLPVRLEELILPKIELAELAELEDELSGITDEKKGRTDDEDLEFEFSKMSLLSPPQKVELLSHQRSLKLEDFHIFPDCNNVKIDTQVLFLYFSRVCKFSHLQRADVSYQGDDSFLNQCLYLISKTNSLKTLTITFLRANSKSDAIHFAKIRLHNIMELNLSSLHNFPLLPRLKLLNLIGKQLRTLSISDQRLKLFEVELWIKRIKELKTLRTLHFENTQSLIIDVKSVKDLLIYLLNELDLRYCRTRLMRGSTALELNREMSGVYATNNLLYGSNFE